MKCLVGIMYCGENEYSRCVDALNEQTGIETDYFIIENQPNKIAHDLLYSTFNENAEKYSHFAKLDADMVFTKNTALLKILEVMLLDDLDHLMVDVKDGLSELFIPGFNVYSNRVKWEGNSDNLIVDYHGSVKKGKRISDAHFVDHMPSPNGYQSFCFGVHRALKAVQPGRQKDIARAVIHWTILSQIAEAEKRVHDINRSYALLGAGLVFTNKELQKTAEYKGDEMRALFDGQIEQYVKENPAKVLNDWLNPIKSSSMWLNAFLTS